MIRHAKFVALAEILGGTVLAVFGGPLGWVGGGTLMADGATRMATSMAFDNKDSYGVLGLVKRLALIRSLNRKIDLKFR